MDADDRQQGRRTFFREGLAHLVGPLIDLIDTHAPSPERQPLLRPPGAIDETDFLKTCQRSGECIAACPANAIRWLERSGDTQRRHTPVIDPDLSACVVCDGLLCTRACPSGALTPLEQPSQIRMGLAAVYEPACVRNQGETCTLCVDMCPIGETALRFPDARAPEVLSQGCVGCGVCQHVCPTSPKAITVSAWRGPI